MHPAEHLLRDIRGLDAAPWWLLAPGWWLVLLMIALLAPFAWWTVRTWQMRREGWRRDARGRLKALQRELGQRDAKDLVGELSELLRRIAMARGGRRTCAGLTGNEWLDWLQQRDPTGFDWREKGRFLLEIPYAPTAQEVNVDELRGLIEAADNWVQGDLPAKSKSESLETQANPLTNLRNRLSKIWVR